MVEIIPWLTVHPLSVILTGITRVVTDGKECVLTLPNYVNYRTIQTTDVYTESGGNQMALRSGDMT